MKENAQSFRVPDKPAEASPAHGSKKMFSKLNSLTRQFTGTSLDVPDNQDSDGFEGQNGGNGGNGELPKSDSSHSLDIPNSTLLWVVDPRPEYSADYYNFTLYSMCLNQITDDLKPKLPPTDSRLRPDVKLLEDGDLGEHRRSVPLSRSRTCAKLCLYWP